MKQTVIAIRRACPELNVDFVEIGSFVEGSFLPYSESEFDKVVTFDLDLKGLFFRSDFSSKPFIRHSDVGTLVSCLCGDGGYSLDFFTNTIILTQNVKEE